MAEGAVVVTTLDTPLCALGEGPVWVEREASVYWTDIHNRRLWRRDEAGFVTGWDMPERLCSFAFIGDGRMIAAFESGIAHYALETHRIDWIVRPYTKDEGYDSNDGKLSSTGWFYSGSMDEACKDDIGALWAVSPDGDARQVLDGICVSNSLAFSPDGRTAWFANSIKHRIDRYSVDALTGAFGDRTLHLDCARFSGVPDGSCLDSSGRLWTAFYGGACVVCSDDAGRVLAEIVLPACQPTCCVIGGIAGDTLYVTTAAENLTEADFAAFPANGRLLQLEGVL